MTTGDLPSQSALGFLTILEHEQHGLVGGYLILNAAGRPLEFHCTAPVRATRAQQILFGPTLESYLYGEQIGQALLTRSTLELAAVCTDVERALCVRDYVALPVALVLTQASIATAPPSGAVGDVSPTIGAMAPTHDVATPAIDQRLGISASDCQWRVDAAQRTGPHLSEFSLGANRLAVPVQRQADRDTITARLEAAAIFDLSEPFERIRQAIAEAHKTGRA
jgi:hypothetical protein